MNQSKKKVLFKIGILLAILLLPSLVYMFLSTGINNFKRLEIYGPKTVAEGSTTDTIYHTIPPFRFVNQNGDSITNMDYEGKIYVADFFFASCPTICPKMSTHMLQVQKAYYDLKNFKLVSFTVNPENDSVPVLKEYSERVHARDSVWNFLTGDKEKLYDLAYEGFYATALQDGTAPGGYIHSSNLYLVDGKGRIRGIFDGTSTTETNNLKDAIEILYKEQFVPLKEH